MCLHKGCKLAEYLHKVWKKISLGLIFSYQRPLLFQLMLEKSGEAMAAAATVVPMPQGKPSSRAPRRHRISYTIYSYT